MDIFYLLFALSCMAGGFAAVAIEIKDIQRRLNKLESTNRSDLTGEELVNEQYRQRAEAMEMSERFKR